MSVAVPWSPQILPTIFTTGDDMKKLMLSLLMISIAGCGGGGSETSNTAKTTFNETTLNPEVARPQHESTLVDVKQSEKGIMEAIASTSLLEKIADRVEKDIPDAYFDISANRYNSVCKDGGKRSLLYVISGYDRGFDGQYENCVTDGNVLNGTLFRKNNADSSSNYYGSESFDVELSNNDKNSLEYLYIQSRKLNHVVVGYPASETLSFDMTVDFEHPNINDALNANNNIDLSGSVIAKTTQPLSFDGGIQTAPLSGEIIITNTKGKIWRGVVVQNGFDIYEGTDENEPPVDFLSWYSIVQ